MEGVCSTPKNPNRELNLLACGVMRSSIIAPQPEAGAVGKYVSRNDMVTAQAIRRVVLTQAKTANVGHIGSALSVAEIVAALFGGVLRLTPVGDPDRDRFVLSKGHAAMALYAALFLAGSLTEAQLASYCADGSLLGVHPEHTLPEVDFSTGSLGHGLPFGAGAALAARLQGSPRRVFVLLSDGECNEGSTWEAAMFAAHHRLSALVAIIDVNGQQAFGSTGEVLNLEPLAQRWQAFGWDTTEIDGHDELALKHTIENLDTAAAAPHVIVARTVFGKGVSFMERHLAWHYLPMSDEQYRQALGEIGETW